MSTNTQALDGNPPPKKTRTGYWGRIGGKFLILSIMAHLLFLTGAAYYVIQFISPKKLTFKAGVPSVNPVKDIAEHKMSMAKKSKSMSAPAPAKRVVTTGLANVSLPPMPEMPTNVVTPTQIVGIGGFGMGFGAGGGGTGDGGGGGGGYMAPFGTSNPHPGMLVGQYYDFKFTRGGQPTHEFDGKYADMITDFVKGGWNESKFSRIYKGPTKLYTTQIFFPEIDTSEGPKAFGNKIANNEGGKWIAVYKGTVCPPETGTYYFIGAGDDDIIVNFDGKNILNNCEHIPSDVAGTGEYHPDGLRNKFERSQPVQVIKDKPYEIKILIGDDVPTKMMAMLLVEKEGVNYDKAGNFPIVPVFSVGQKTTIPGNPPHLDGPNWSGKSSTSLMDMFDNGN